MATSPHSPKLIKGGIVLLDSSSGAVLRVIALQYNTHLLTRSLQAQWLYATAEETHAGLTVWGIL